MNYFGIYKLHDIIALDKRFISINICLISPCLLWVVFRIALLMQLTFDLFTARANLCSYSLYGEMLKSFSKNVLSLMPETYNV